MTLPDVPRVLYAENQIAKNSIKLVQVRASKARRIVVSVSAILALRSMQPFPLKVTRDMQHVAGLCIRVVVVTITPVIHS